MTWSECTSLANQVSKLEQEGLTLSADWYHFNTIRTEDLQQLLSIQHSSLTALEELSQQLDKQVRDNVGGQTQQDAQYAYDLTQELIASRKANRELIQNMLGNSNQQHPEFGRALAIKEKAAATQAKKLEQTISRLQ